MVGAKLKGREGPLRQHHAEGACILSLPWPNVFHPTGAGAALLARFAKPGDKGDAQSPSAA